MYQNWVWSRRRARLFGASMLKFRTTLKMMAVSTLFCSFSKSKMKIKDYKNCFEDPPHLHTAMKDDYHLRPGNKIKILLFVHLTKSQQNLCEGWPLVATLN
jgi:hypothetical protein